MPDPSTVCPACGARLADDATACDLCGHDLALPTDDDLLDAEDDAVVDETAPRSVAAAPRGVFCNACGHANPPGARFCSNCGAALQTAGAVAAPAPVVAPTMVTKAAGLDVPTGTRLWAMVGGAALLVAGLFALRAVRHDAPVTNASGGAAPVATAPAAGGDPTAPPDGQSLAPTGELATLTPAQTRQLDSLRGVVDGLSGSAQTDKRRELARLQYAFGRPDEAGQTMETVAAASSATEDWRSAGDFLYQWMETLPEDQRGPVATRVMAAYEAVLAKQDGDLDSRTRLGWASQYAGDNPMRAVMETQAVLQADSNHVGANYNRAFLLLKIGRTDQALVQLRKVQRLAGAETALGRQAGDLIQAIEQQTSAAAR